MRVALIDYESGNLHSAAKAVSLVGAHRGAEVQVTADPEVVARADRGNYPVLSFTDTNGDSHDYYPSLTALTEDGLVHGFRARQAARRHPRRRFRCRGRPAAAIGDVVDAEVAGALQQHQALAVLHMERLLLATLAVEEQATVGERPVHVEDQRAELHSAASAAARMARMFSP